MVEGLVGFSSYFLNDYRHENLHYFYHQETKPNGSEFENGTFVVVVYKADSNGTCYAFTQSMYMNNMPHDTDDDWELLDIKHCLLGAIYGKRTSI